jgi:DNA-binding GntR family transcriptional regulator
VNFAKQTIGAAPATPALASALDVPEGTALLRLVRRSFLKDGDQIVLKDHLNIYYNPDYFQY